MSLSLLLRLLAFRTQQAGNDCCQGLQLQHLLSKILAAELNCQNLAAPIVLPTALAAHGPCPSARQRWQRHLPASVADLYPQDAQAQPWPRLPLSPALPPTLRTPLPQTRGEEEPLHRQSLHHPVGQRNRHLMSLLLTWAVSMLGVLLLMRLRMPDWGAEPR